MWLFLINVSKQVFLFQDYYAALRDPEKGKLTQDSKQKKPSSELVVFFVWSLVGRAGFEPAKFSQQIYSLPSLAA